jgi:hypothetical protein
MEAFISRKFLVSVIGAAVIALNEKFGLSLDPEAVFTLGSIIVAYVTGQAVVDKNKLNAEAKAMADAGMVQLKTEANAIISALTAKLEAIQGQSEAPSA